MTRKAYHPRKASLGPWAKRSLDPDVWDGYDGGANAELNGDRWVAKRNEGLRQHQRLMATDPLYRATVEVTAELHRQIYDAAEWPHSFLFPETFDGGTFIAEPITHGNAKRNALT